MRNLFTALMIVVFCALSAPATIGKESDVSTALGISINDLHRMEVAVGKHQHLLDTAGQIRSATLEETVKEMVSRMNEIVIREEAKVRQAEIEAKMVPIQIIESK